MPVSTRIVLLAALAGSTLPALAQSTEARGPAAVKASASRESAARPTDELPIRRLTLYRSGVGSFERRGPVEGDAHVHLKFETGAINDILKSMIVLDLSGRGQVAGVTYGSKEPLARRLASFGVDLSGQPSLAELIARLRGAEVVITLPEGPVSGTILGVETRVEAHSEQLVQVPYVNLLTGAGIRSINLTQAISVSLADEGLNAELHRALAAVDEQRAERTKTMDISLTGEGRREVVVAYVQEAPVWKVSYRLVLPDEEADAGRDKNDDKHAEPASKGTIHAWAIVENTTDEDWKTVVLSLVAGRPVSFRMDLYEPLYAARPEVPVPTVPGAMPRIYAEGGQVPAEAPEPPAPAAPAAKADLEERAFARRVAGRLMDKDAAANKLAELKSVDLAQYAAASQARAVETGEVFRYEIETPVSIDRQTSAMLPILSTPLRARRVSIYSAADGIEHPMRGVEVTNTTGMQLIPGPISVFDAGVYAGDAQIGHVPRGDKRLLAYAVDLEVNARVDQDRTSRVQKLRIVKGLVEMTSKQVSQTTYQFTNKDEERSRTLVVEHPRDTTATLVEPKKPDDQTDSLYRFEVALAPGGKAPLRVVQERVDHTTYQITQIDLTTVMQYRTSGVASEAVVNAFKEAARRQGVVSDAQHAIEQLEHERSSISEEQTRIRQNMGTIDRTSQLYARYMQKLTDQEARLDAISTELAAKHDELNKAQADLNAYLSNLSVE